MPSRAWGGVGGCEQTLGGRGHSHEDRWLLILSLVIRQSCLDAACETHPAHALALAALVYYNEKWNGEALALLILTGETGMHLQA